MIRPLALELPLQGRQWIEASAGTGKTFTLSLLVLRMLLEREIALPNILAVTFTKAATQELKIKIREQIKSALDLLQQELPEDVASLDARKRATASLLKNVLPEKPARHLSALLETALQDCDRASIFTIHGFCTRVLGDHALNAGQLLQAPVLLTDTVALNTKIAFDIWREFSQDRELMRSLTRLWPSPEVLAKQCESLIKAENLLPELSAAMPVDFDMQSLHLELRSAFDLHFDGAKTLMLENVQAGIFHKSHMSAGIVESSFDKLENWYWLDQAKAFEDQGFHRLSGSYVANKVTKEHKQKTPASPLFDAIERWHRGFEQAMSAEQARDIRCLHIVRERLKSRREEVLQQWQQYAYDDLITRVANAVAGESGDELCNDLRKEYPVALVDEFQDTDSLQWKIFSTLYPESRPENALYLIGDPKQAIYGFRGGDVHAYLAAKRETLQHWNLPENFRTRPGLLSAVESLFGRGGDNAFRERDIRFFPVQSGGSVQENDFMLDDTPGQAMELALLPEHVDPKTNVAVALPAGKAREIATQACVEKIHQFLSAGQRGKARIIDKDGDSKAMRNLLPGDIAVLVNTNAEATQVQAALSECGIASVIGGQENLYGTLEAREVFILLDALMQHRDQARWRGALSTVLLGYHASQIRDLESDDIAATRSADLAVHYREIWLKQGVLALLSQLCAAAAPRLLALADGERRLSNYLQLAESLQQASALTLGPEQCLRWLGKAMQDIGSDEEDMLRLDSDQKRVKILTVHKSKGLEFPMVFMPFANFGKSARSGTGLSLLNYHRDHHRITHAMLYGDDNKKLVDAIKAAAAEEQIAEQVRLLYVALTRAQYYCWLCCGSVAQADKSGLSSLLFRNDKDIVKTPSQQEYFSRLESLRQNNSQIGIENLSCRKALLPRFVDAQELAAIPIAKPGTHLQMDWRVSSFSQLSHGSHYQSPSVSAAADEIEMAGGLSAETVDAADRRFAGVAFGNALHQALENIDMEVWRAHADSGLPPESEWPILHQALLRQGYVQEELVPGTQKLGSLIFNTVHATLPESLRLCDLPDRARLNEMEFHFSLRECDSHALLGLLKQYGVLQQREDFPQQRRLVGLMTGKIDLIYRHEGRFYICDYKSNRLTAYDAGHCRQAMRDSEYDFQALIYTLALHRWCKFRLQSHYDYEKHIGGIRYLFCRGLNAAENNGDGIVAMRFDYELIEKMEGLLCPETEAMA